METPGTKLTIVPLPADISALCAGGTGSAVLVAGTDAAAVGEAVAALRAAGLPAAGWVGDPSDPEVREMAAELFPGLEIVTPR